MSGAPIPPPVSTLPTATRVRVPMTVPVMHAYPDAVRALVAVYVDAFNADDPYASGLAVTIGYLCDARRGPASVLSSLRKTELELQIDIDLAQKRYPGDERVKPFETSLMWTRREISALEDVLRKETAR